MVSGSEKAGMGMNKPLKYRGDPQQPRRRGAAKGKPSIEDRRRIAAEFDMMIEEDIATLCGISLKGAKNRHQADLPPYTNVGGKKLFRRGDVDEWLNGRRRRSPG